MGSINLRKKLNLQILLKLDMKESELVLAEFSRLFPQSDKKILDWEKLIRLCKDCFDERYNVFFEKKLTNNTKAELINLKLRKILILGIQVIQDRIIISALDLYEGVFYRIFPICNLVIPLRISSYQVVENFIKNALKVRYIVEKIVEMSVKVIDEINYLPIDENYENQTSTSMMSTTYSP